MGKLDKINYIIKDPNRKNLLQILIESMHAGFIEKEIPIFYFYNLLYKKDSNDYRNYVGMKKRYNILNHFYSDHKDIFTNKIKFNNLLTSHNIPTPKFLAQAKNYTIKYNFKEYNVQTESELENVLKILIKASSTQSIFVKPLDGAGGSLAFKFDQANFDSIKINKLFNSMKNRSFIFQETIIQNNKIKQIYPDSINTLRIYTYPDKDTQETEIILALMRVGSKGRVVDNGSMFVRVDIEDQWTLTGNAKSFLDNEGKSFREHPDTSFLFDDFKIPFQEDIYKILKNAAPLLPNDYIGWDVALSEDRPMIIEANDRPHVIMTQIMAGGFKGHPKYRKIMKDYI